MTCDTWNPESDTPTSNLSAQVGKSKAHDRCEHHTTTIEEAEAMSNAIHAAKKQLRLLVRQRLAGLDQANLHAQCEVAQLPGRRAFEQWRNQFCIC